MMDSPYGQRGLTGGGDLPPSFVVGGHNQSAGWMTDEQSNHASTGLIRFNPIGAHSQLFQNQHQNQFLQQLQNVSAASAGTSDWQGSEYQASRGEVIPGKMFTYHSISELEGLVPEHQTLSLDTESSSAKVFKIRGNSILALSQEDNDIQLLINQVELVANLLAPFKCHNSSSLPSSLPALTDPILDFTLCSRNRLYLLYPELLAVLDLSNLLAPRTNHSPSKTVFDTQPDFLDWVALPSSPSYNALKSTNMNGSLHLLLYNTKASQIITHLAIKEGSQEQQVLVSDVFESDQVQHRLRDGETKDRNEVQVIDLKLKQIVFKAYYKDTTSKVVKLYYISQTANYGDVQLQNETPQSSDSEIDHQQPLTALDPDSDRFKDDEVVGEDDDETEDVQQIMRQGQKRLPLFRDATIKDLIPSSEDASQKQFGGFFLFVENLPAKDPTTQKNHNYFEKLSLAKIINKPAGNPLKSSDQRLQLLDYLKISEKSRKLVEFDQRRGIVFLMNKKASPISSTNIQPCLKLYAVRLKPFYSEVGVNNSDSDSEDRIKNSPVLKDGGEAQEASGIKFSFIKGMHLQMGNQVLHSISTSQTSSAKRPKFFKILTKKNASQDSINPLTYYIYTSIGGQIITHSLQYPQQLSPMNQVPQQSTASHVLPFTLHPHSSPNLFTRAPLQQEEHQSIFGLDPFFSLGATHQLESDPLASVDGGARNTSIQPTMSFGETRDQDEVTTALLLVDDLQEEVNREMQEAIEKEMEVINDVGGVAQQEVIIEEDIDLLQKLIIQNIEAKKDEEEKKSVNEEETQEKVPAGKEIQLSADQFKLIQAAKQGAVVNAAEKKKKKKAAKKAAAAAQGNTTPTTAQVNEEVKLQKATSPTQAPRPLPTQASTISASTLPFTVVAPPQAQMQVATYQPKAAAQPAQKPPTQAQQPPAQPAQNNKAKNNGAATKSPEDTLLDTFAELTKKYQDLSQKFQKLQDQLTNQSQQQAELDRCIAKNINQVVPSVIELQLKEKIVPLVLTHMKTLDRNIRDDILPHLHQQVSDLLSRLVRQHKISQLSQQQEEELRKRGILIDESVQGEIKALVVEEFAKAMEAGVRPMLVEQFAGIVTEVRNNLKIVNEDIAKRVADEMERQQDDIRKVHQRMDAIQAQLQSQQAQAMYPPTPLPYVHHYPPNQPHYPHPTLPTTAGSYPYPPYYPPQYYHPPTHYHPPPQMTPYGPPPTYQGLAPTLSHHQSEPIHRAQGSTLTDMNLTPSVHHHPMHPQQQIQQQTQYSSQNYSPLVIPPAFGSNQHQPYFNHHVNQSAVVKQTTPSFSANDPLHQQQLPPPPLKHSATQICLGNQDAMMLMYNDEGDNTTGGAITPLSGMQGSSHLEEIKVPHQPPSNVIVKQQTAKISKEKSVSSLGSNPSVEDVTPTKKKGKQAQKAAQKAQLDQLIDGGDAQVPAPNKKWQILPYMKDVATQGKCSSADFLLCGSQEFLEETVQFVSENSHIITNQYSYKIIHQFIKKVYNRAKENEKARKGAAIILGVFIDKIYRVRENMKQLVCQATAMESEIKALIEDD